MRKFFKWTGIVLGSLIGLILITLGLIYLGTNARIKARMDVPVTVPPFHSDSVTIATGRYLAVAVAKCVDCHGDNLGGKRFIEAPIGTIDAPNITSGKGSVVKNFTDTDWVRAIRHAVAPNGRPLWVMPAEDFQGLSGEELNCIVSWVKSMPPVDNVANTHKITMLGRVLMALGSLPLLPAEKIDHEAPLENAPPPGETVEYGRHMAIAGGCMGCHGPTLSGGPIPGAPPDWPQAQNITPDTKTGIGSWSQADFFRALREGKRPAGDTINSIMPWRYTRQLNDVDIKALYKYLRTVQPKPFGER